MTFIKKKQKISDLDKMSEEEYLELKTAEMEEAVNWVNKTREDKDPMIVVRDVHPVTDLRNMLKQTVSRCGDNPLYHQVMKGDKEYSTITYNEAFKHINGLGTALINLGLKGAHIGVIGQNCYEWVESYLAVTCGTGVVVPLDRELPPEDLANLCREGDIKAVICCADKFYDVFKTIKEDKKNGLEYVIGVNKEEHEDVKQGLLSWNLLRAEGMKLVEEGDRRFLDARIRNTDLAVIIFTSGTTGVAKGVMLSHKNIVSDIMLSNPYIEIRQDDISYSFLPLHHTYECTCSTLFVMSIGASVAFSRGFKYLLKDMQMVKPTHFLAVPLIFEKLYNSIQKSLVKEGKDKALNRLIAVNRVTSKIGINLAKSAAKKITDQFGGRIRTFIVGGAKANPEILDFFSDLGIMTLQGYGLTETSPMVALNPDNIKYRRNASAGKLLQHTECKVVAPDENGNGELCFRGPQIMLGYYNNQEATDDCMEDGWFHTGDLGYIDKDNFVYITGRKKSVIIAANGKNVFPEELEQKLLNSKYIDECMVWADESGEQTGKKGIYVTVKINDDNINEIIGSDEDKESAILKIIDQEIDKVNANLPDWKNIKHFIIKKSDFIKTTGMKIKRFVEENKKAD